MLAAPEFDALWARLGLGPLPVALRVASPGRADGERLEIRADGWTALRDRGLAGPAGPDPELVRMLRLLAAPRQQLELRGHWDRAVRIVAAGGPGPGVVAVRQDATLALRPCGVLPDALVEALPAAGVAGTARIVALTADGRGALHRAPGSVTIIDGADGRQLATRAGDVLPGDPPTLRREIAALLG